MKRGLIISFISIAVFSVSVAGQAKIVGEKLTHDENLVRVSFDVEPSGKVQSRYKEVIMPYICAGKDTLWFDVLEIYGKSRYMRERQEKYLKGDKKWELGENRIMAGTGYRYESAVPVKNWMKSASVGIKRYMAGCACEEQSKDTVLKKDLALYTDPIVLPRKPLCYVLSDVTGSWNFGEDELIIKFTVGESRIDPYLFDNSRTIAKILEAVDRICSDGRYRMEHIDVTGFASPEGSRQLNTVLAQRRADALIDYIITHRPQYHLTRRDFRIYNGDVNWTGLLEYMGTHDMPEKVWVNSIVAGNLSDDRKIALLRSLDGGMVWKKLLREVFPHLRSARFRGVYFDSYRKDNATEQINEANAMIREGRYTDAYNHLLHLRGDIRAYNTIGVSLMMQGMFDEAIIWFEMAVRNGCPSAASNIAAIKAELLYRQQDAEEIAKYMKKYE